MPRIHLLLLGQYTSLGLLGGFSLQLLPAYLRRAGIGLDSIALVALIFLPHALKLAWAPAVDAHCRRHRRTCLRLCYGGLLACVAVLAGIDPASRLNLALALLTLAAFCAATGDIASDGLAVQALPAEDYPQVNRLQIGGSYLGYLIAGLLVAPLIGHVGWHAGVLLLMVLVAIALLPLLAFELPEVTPSSLPRPSLRGLWRPLIRRAASLVLLVQIGPRLLLGMASAYWIERGLSLSGVGVLEAWCISMGLLGSLLAPSLLQRLAIRGSLILGLLALLGACAWLVIGERRASIGIGQLIALFSLANLACGLIFVALYSHMMRCADPAQPGTDVTALQCVDAWIGLLAGFAGAWLAHWFGFDGRFLIAAAALCLALIALPMLIGPGRTPNSKESLQP
ncbi:MFS transporter [Pseudomonas sp. LRF_L74]|uniref:MFS transporter n=1 Tax=Pseudomonas sp. LRF_L74 TaxID=3369422 RepID=UPI003F5E8C1B